MTQESPPNPEVTRPGIKRSVSFYTMPYDEIPSPPETDLGQCFDMDVDINEERPQATQACEDRPQAMQKLEDSPQATIDRETPQPESTTPPQDAVEYDFDRETRRASKTTKCPGKKGHRSSIPAVSKSLRV